MGLSPTMIMTAMMIMLALTDSERDAALLRQAMKPEPLHVYGTAQSWND